MKKWEVVAALQQSRMSKMEKRIMTAIDNLTEVVKKAEQKMDAAVLVLSGLRKTVSDLQIKLEQNASFDAQALADDLAGHVTALGSALSDPTPPDVPPTPDPVPPAPPADPAPSESDVVPVP